MSNLIAVVTHKQVDIPIQKGYQIITVGNNPTHYEDALSDRTDDNIAEKNNHYCELTAQYWLWKNGIEKYDNVGLVHYRRFFGKKRFSAKESNILSEAEIERILQKADIILPKEFYWPCSVREYYFKHGVGKENDIAIVEEIIKKDYPEYYNSYIEVMKGNHGSYCNMLITTNDNFCEYSKWLFDILGKAETQIDMSEYTPAEARVFGYLSEILLNVWVKKQGLKIFHAPILETEYKEKRYYMHVLKRIRVNFVNELHFLF